MSANISVVSVCINVICFKLAPYVYLFRDTDIF